MIKLNFIAILLLISLQGLSQTANEYLSSISEQYQPINKDTWSYIKQVSKGRNAGRVDKKRVELINTLTQAKYKVSQLGGFEGNTSLRNDTQDYLNILILTLKNDYRKIVDLEQIAEESYDDMEAYLLTKERVSAKTEVAFNSYKQSYERFAQENNITLVEGESRISKKLDNAGEVMSYYNKVYLLFYKSYWYEKQLLNALQEQNIGDAEQFRETLASVAQASMDSLAKINAFYQDASLKESCHELLYFFHGEAVRYMPDQIDFLLKQKKMNELSAAMKSKPQNKLTQQEIDQYNAAINEYNTAVQDFNKTSEYLNKFRSKSFDNWNNTGEDFYDEYI